MKVKIRLTAGLICILMLLSLCVTAVAVRENIEENPEMVLVGYIADSLSTDAEKTGKSKEELIKTKGTSLGISVERAIELGLTTGVLLSKPLSEYIENINYEIVDATAVIKGFEEETQTVVIPAKIAGYPISLRGDQVLKNSDIKQVVFCEGTKEIGYAVLSRCDNIESVALPASLEGIRGSAFDRCANLKSINIPLNVSRMGAGVFSKCTALESIAVPEGVISCGDAMFQGCENLRTVYLPQSLITLGERAFDGCKRLESVTLPQSLSYMGEGCFCDCESLKKVVIPKNVKVINKGVFRNCTALEEVVLHDKLQQIGDCAFGGCTSLEKIILPENLENLDRQSFSHCDNLKEIVIPDTVTEIRDRTFVRCLNLSSVYIPDEVTKISDFGFYLCLSLTDIYYEGTEEQWQSMVFGESAGLSEAEVHFESDNIEKPSEPEDDILPATDDVAEVVENNIKYRVQGKTAAVIGYIGTADEVKIPSEIGGATITEIDRDAFVACDTIKVLYLSEGIKTIKPYAFGLCTNLREVYLPYSIKEISDFAFYSCSQINKVTYAGDKESWKEVAVGLSNDSVTDVRNFICLSNYNFVNSDTKEPLGEPEEGYVRYYFYMHDAWRAVGGENRMGLSFIGKDSASDNPWGDVAKRTDEYGIFCFDLPENVTRISWNNLYNTGWSDKCKTESFEVNSDMADMILVLYKESGSVVDDTSVYGGEWFYYYGNGEYGNTKNREDAEKILSASFVYAPDSTDPLATATGPVITPFDRGDVNTDKEINIKDATLLQKYLAKLVKFDYTQKGLADANLDYKTDVRDVTYIQKMVAKLI